MLALLWVEWLSVYSCVGSDHGLHLRVLMAQAKLERASSRQQDSGGGGCLLSHLPLLEAG